MRLQPREPPLETIHGLRPPLAELRVNVGDLPFTVAGLADHMPIHYATHLWNALLTSGPAP